MQNNQELIPILCIWYRPVDETNPKTYNNSKCWNYISHILVETNDWFIIELVNEGIIIQ